MGDVWLGSHPQYCARCQQWPWYPLILDKLKHNTNERNWLSTNQEMPGDSFFGPGLVNAVNSGQVSQARLNDMAVRILTSLYAIGVMNSPNPTGMVSSTSLLSLLSRLKYYILRKLGSQRNVSCAQHTRSSTFRGKTLQITNSSKLLTFSKGLARAFAK